jgi:hypothetical protein
MIGLGSRSLPSDTDRLVGAAGVVVEEIAGDWGIGVRRGTTGK